MTAKFIDEFAEKVIANGFAGANDPLIGCYINNNIMCDPCERLLRRMLAPGSKLEVYLPDGSCRLFTGEPL